ncbi:MAG: penicillin-binding protein 1B [Methylococcales symbiont of Hymedesmia sp. n. MRB-2018]|nr:MAG: penicillin-binding protein 1B [Methylococcales symbiont of Hymedesmia sp. n. MRB-2018]
MAKKITKSKARKKKVIKQPLHWFKKLLLYCFLGFVFLFCSYIGYLDYTVRKQFEGKRWSIPARVYASPVEVYQSYQMTIEEFEDLLLQLRYRRDYSLSSVATYYKKGQQISLKTRSFNFWDKKQSSQQLRIIFSNKSVQKIINLKTFTEMPILRMDPVHVGSFYPTRKEDRILIKLENTPNSLIQGLMATEDRNFYHHFGVSPKAIVRALWANISAGTVVQGGSTITQQLVKNFYLSSEKRLWRKINEAFMALILEYHYQKDEILEAYLNEIYLGQDGASSVHGFGLASEFYFGQPLKSLALHNVAALVALVRGPSYYDPRRYKDRSIKRRNLVLEKMHQQGYITKKQEISAKKKKLNVISRSHRSVNRYPSFLDLVKKELRKEYREDDLTSEGLRIFTTLDTQIQKVLEKTITQKLAHLEKKPNTRKLQTASIVTRRESGEIVALAGGRNPRGVGFNRALKALRPIGSLIKPVVYLTALEYPDRYNINTYISDTAITVKGKNGEDWKPKNYDNKEHGEVPLHIALAKSYNLATVHLGMDIGIARIAKTLRNMGVSRSVDLFPSLLLGATPLTPLEVTQMYQTLAGDGFLTPLRSIQAVIAADGERIQSYPYTLRQVLDPAATYITNKILQQVMSIGTGRSAYLSIPREFALAGKTGTTNKLRDSWFAGFSGDYLSVFWVGRDDNKPTGLTGGSGALQIWTSLMKQISKQPVDLIAPDNIERHWIDPYDGLLANEDCADAVSYPFIKGSAPEQYSPCASSTVNRAKTWFNDFLQDNF